LDDIHRIGIVTLAALENVNVTAAVDGVVTSVADDGVFQLIARAR